MWGGPLCVIGHGRTYAELSRIQRELGNGAVGTELGLQTTWSGVDIRQNVVEVGVVVADDHAEQAVEDRYGEGVVVLRPALVPVDEGS